MRRTTRTQLEVRLHSSEPAREDPVIQASELRRRGRTSAARALLRNILPLTSVRRGPYGYGQRPSKPPRLPSSDLPTPQPQILSGPLVGIPSPSLVFRSLHHVPSPFLSEDIALPLLPIYTLQSSNPKHTHSSPNRICDQRYQNQRGGMVWVFFLCIDAEKILGKQQAPGSCPCCGGPVIATDVETQWRFCFLPLCLWAKRSYSCARCARQLDVITG